MDVQPLINQARRLIVDAGALKRVADASLLEYLNDGLRYCVAVNPYTLTGRVDWETGAEPTAYHTLLSAASVVLPEGAQAVLFVIDVPELTLTDEKVLTLEVPGWRVTTATGTVRNWIRSADSSVGFYTYPAAEPYTVLQADCCLEPAEALSTDDDLVGLRPEYQPALINYIVSRALAEDADNVNNMNLSDGYLAKANAVIEQIKVEDTARWNTRI